MPSRTSRAPAPTGSASSPACCTPPRPPEAPGGFETVAARPPQPPLFGNHRCWQPPLVEEGRSPVSKPADDGGRVGASPRSRGVRGRQIDSRRLVGGGGASCPI